MSTSLLTGPMGASVAKDLARHAISEARRATAALPQGADGPLAAEVTRQVKRAVCQDPAWRSWRVWGAIWSGVTLALTALELPEVQAAIHAVAGQVVPPAWLPLATALLGTLWPLISKARDRRPRRTSSSNAES